MSDLVLEVAVEELVLEVEAAGVSVVYTVYYADGESGNAALEWATNEW
ncbi:MAG: hypothetical protein SFU83_23460 [Meiothermus sp.]|nr:hypothetical protein [Meiothermus sp.]